MDVVVVGDGARAGSGVRGKVVEREMLIGGLTREGGHSYPGDVGGQKLGGVDRPKEVETVVRRSGEERNGGVRLVTVHTVRGGAGMPEVFARGLWRQIHTRRREIAMIGVAARRRLLLRITFAVTA